MICDAETKFKTREVFGLAFLPKSMGSPEGKCQYRKIFQSLLSGIGKSSDRVFRQEPKTGLFWTLMRTAKWKSEPSERERSQNGH